MGQSSGFMCVLHLSAGRERRDTPHHQEEGRRSTLVAVYAGDQHRLTSQSQSRAISSLRSLRLRSFCSLGPRYQP